MAGKGMYAVPRGLLLYPILATSFAQEPDMPIWPMPLKYTHGNQVRVISSNLVFTKNEESSDMDAAFKR